MMSAGVDNLTLEYILLGLLKDEPRHGYALYRTLQDTPELSRIWHVKRGKVYYLLDKLADQGLLSSRVMAVDQVPDRKVYSLTEAGLEAFRSWYRTPVRSGRVMRVSFLSRLFFALRDSRRTALALVREQVRETDSWLNNLQEQMDVLDSPDLITEQVYLFRIGQVRAMLDWLEGCRKSIQENA